MALVWTWLGLMPDAYAAKEPYVPDVLRPWVDWALADDADTACAFVHGVRQCVWPSELTLDVRGAGALFVLRVHTDRALSVPLPGNAETWPQHVMIDDKPAQVQANGDHAVVPNVKGTHVIRGEFLWPSAPEMLAMPANCGFISLTINGQAVERPRLDEAGRLFLGDAKADGINAEDTVRAVTYRRLDDGVPMQLTTRVELNVSGRAREIDLGRLTLPGTRPVAVQAALPVQMSGDGHVHVFVRTGRFVLDVLAVMPTPATTLAVPQAQAAFFDAQEVWAWFPSESTRSVELRGLTAVAADRTTLPNEWANGVTFLAKAGDALELTVTRRGLADPPPNRVSLQRSLWLDLDGSGYTVRDALSGTLEQTWRLNYQQNAGGKLGQFTLADQDALITTDPTTGAEGVELREASLQATAVLRLDEARRVLAMVGWDHDMQSLDATLHLPPGWTLLGGTGIDNMGRAWMHSWNLWDLFFVLMVAAAFGRLFRWWMAPVAAAALILAHDQPDAPQWVWLHLIGSLALLRVLPQGRWRTAILVYRVGALAVCALILLPFAREHLMQAMFPQTLVESVHSIDSTSTIDGVFESLEPDEIGSTQEAGYADLEQNEGNREEEKPSQQWQRALDKSVSYETGGRLQQVDPNAVVQTGPGVPTWRFTSWPLRWSGPVRRDHEVTLWLVSPFANAIRGVLCVALLLMLALVSVAPRDMVGRGAVGPLPAWWPRMFAGFFGVALLTFAIPAAASDPGGGYPSDSLLQTLRARLIAQTVCEAPCVSVSRVDMTAAGLLFDMQAEVHAHNTTGWTLPGPYDALALRTVTVDGEPAELRREPGGAAVVRLTAGRHMVRVLARLDDRNEITLQFDASAPPRMATFRSNDWQQDGIDARGIPKTSLQLLRTQPQTERRIETAAPELAPWFSVERVFALGLPWKVQTLVTRQETSRPQVLRWRPLPGESVLTEGIRVENGEVVLGFQRGEDTVVFESELPVTAEIVLTAPHDQPFTETWVLACSRIWQCRTEGLAPVAHVESGVYRPAFKPWPGEALTVRVDRPEGSPGDASTVDSVTYSVTPGTRLLEATLELEVRASQGGWQTITLPQGAELQRVVIDGEQQTIRPREGNVSLPVRVGAQTFWLQWQQPWTRGFVERMPKVDIGSEAANARMVMRRGDDRLLLWTLGPRWGPAVLFWPHVVLLGVLAFALGRLRMLPLRTPAWLLLLLGLLQLPFATVVVMLAWFVLLAVRRVRVQSIWWRFNLFQLMTIAMTVAAIAVVVAALYTNFLVDPDMQVAGADSNAAMLVWIEDHVTAALPTPALISVPLFVWRLAMLAWALWLVTALWRWASWGFAAFATGGLWMKKPPHSMVDATEIDGNP